MSKILDVTGDDIANLKDEDLRELIGRLCEAEYRTSGYSPRGVLWGGNQTAEDGGLDVVARSDFVPQSGYITRKNNGLQVKKSDMPRSEIIKEIRPDGQLRLEIKALIDQKGSYIIVSAQGSTSFSAISRRLKTMREAIAAEDPNEDLELDFFDRTRIATWVRSHPSVMIWLREKAGRPLAGWRSYENWSHAPDGLDSEYSIDDQARIYNEFLASEGVDAVKGIALLRSQLRTQKPVRLIGLSGVGKTRLAQALFDDRIGEDSLNRENVFYTDAGGGSDPQPEVFAEQLIALGSTGYLVVDNCGGQLHRTLAALCVRPEAHLKLLTIEYDVRDDLPEETSVWRLEPASQRLMADLIHKRLPHIGQINAKRIAEISGGNARVAFALANTVQVGETLSNFKDEELFNRIFSQRNTTDRELLDAGKALAIVYSFDVQDTESEKSELRFLSGFVEKSPLQMYKIAELLKQRGVIQERSNWRAVLPHAISNYLARSFLQENPIDFIAKRFDEHGSSRLIKSFARRMSFLHDCKQAVEIVEKWASSDGWIGRNLHTLSDDGIDALQSIAPVAPEVVLEAISRTINGPHRQQFLSMQNARRTVFSKLLKLIGFDPINFAKATECLIGLALTAKVSPTDESPVDILRSMFYIQFSGTHATVDQRLTVIKSLLSSDEAPRQEIGVKLLDAMMQTTNFRFAREFSFGARKRDYGLYPKNRAEVEGWFEKIFAFVKQSATPQSSTTGRIFKNIANKFRSMCMNIGIYEQLENIARSIRDIGFWPEGWSAVQETLKYSFPKKAKHGDLLKKLEEYLRPKTLEERVRAYTLRDNHTVHNYELDENEETPWDYSERMVVALGTEIADNIETFRKLLPSLIAENGTNTHALGFGIGRVVKDKRAFWELMKLEAKKQDGGNIGLLRGYLAGVYEVDPTFAENLLDDIHADQITGKWLPLFQQIMPMNDKSYLRLLDSLFKNVAPIQNFANVCYGVSGKTITDDQIVGLIEEIITKEGWPSVVLSMLSTFAHQRPEPSEKVRDLAAQILGMYELYGVPNAVHSDFELTQLANMAFKNRPNKSDEARTACQQYLRGIKENYLIATALTSFLKQVAENYPTVFLDEFVETTAEIKNDLDWLFRNDIGLDKNPLDSISPPQLVEWCQLKPEKRFGLAAESINLVDESENTVEWSQSAIALMAAAPSKEQIFKTFVDGLRPMSWSGSRAEMMENRLALFGQMRLHCDNEALGKLVDDLETDFRKEIEFECQAERERFRVRDQTFE